MEFRDLKKQYAILKPQIDAAVATVLADGNYISGSCVQSFEKELATYVGRKHCISCANGTDALVLALKAFGAGPNHAIFVPDFTFFATAECVSIVGATPIFVDVDKDTFNMCPKSLEAAIEEVKKQGKLLPFAVIPVDLFGLLANYTEICQKAKQHKLLVLEDAAQGFGASFNGKMACSFGNISSLSFFPAKPLGCYGDGGAVFTDDDDVAALLRSLAVHGKGQDKYDNVRIGYNSRLDTIQAAILQVKLLAFPKELALTQKAADAYTALLQKSVCTPTLPPGHTSSFAQYTIKLNSEKQREQVAAALKANGIPTNIYYPRTMQNQTAYKNSPGGKMVPCPNANALCQNVLSLPMHPYLTLEDIEKVSQAVLCAL